MKDKIPEVIYLQWYGLDECDMHDAKIDSEILGHPFPDPDERTWCVDRMYDTDVVYKRVRKQPKDKLEQAIDDLIEERDWYHEQLDQAMRLLKCDDIFVSAEQQMVWKTERDAFLAKQEATDE
jgi:hypothetical protein